MVFLFRVLQLAPAVIFGAAFEVGRIRESIRANTTTRAEFLVLTVTDFGLRSRIFSLKRSESPIIFIFFNYDFVVFKCCAD